MAVDRFILTDPPGSGKTTLIRHLAEDGFATAGEAATDLIAAWQQEGIDEPWTCSSFIDAVVETQKERQVNLGHSARIQFYDRSPICTLALANWLGHPISLRCGLRSKESGAKMSIALTCSSCVASDL